MVRIKKTIFREYDIRGKVNDEEINEKSIELVGRGYGTMLVRRKIPKAVVGYDFREHSERLSQAFIKGLSLSGINIIDLGMILTPMMYAAQFHFKTKGGVMITASHNPNEWSGLKLALGYAETLLPKEIKELYGLVEKEEFVEGEGVVKKAPFIDTYADDLLKRVSIARSFRVVVNARHGTAGAIVPAILKKAGCKVVELYCDLNWNFPHGVPNPSLVEMMEETGKKTREVGADVGLAIDGDGDRLGVTDEQGNTIWPDRYLILLARQVLKERPGAKIIFDVICSQALVEDIESHGGVPIMWITGHSYIKAKLREENAPLAGEMSGHVYYGRPYYFGFDDAVFTALKCLDFLSHQKKTLSELITETPYYITSPTLHIDCPDEKKYLVVEKLTTEFKNEYQVIDINGARVLFDEGWGLVRPSSNLPVLVLRFEAKTEEGLERIQKIFKEKLAKFPEVGKEWRSG